MSIIINVRKRVDQVIYFLEKDIWEVSKANFYQRVIMTVYLSVKRYNGDKLFIKSAALTFSTLLSIIPVLALLFAIVKGFGFSNLLDTDLFKSSPLDQQTLTQTFEFIDNYLSQSKDGVFIGIGVVFLLVTVWGLISTIEDVFNDIWEVKTLRSYTRRFTDYFSFLFIVPFLFIVSSGISIFMSTIFDRLSDLLFLSPLISFVMKGIPFLLPWAVFTTIYVLIPNTKVRATNAIISGFIATVAFNLFQMLYINGQIWVTRYSAIYGSFAALPLLMLWIQVSWLICLMGAEITFAGQNIENLKEEKRFLNQKVSRIDQDFLVIIMTSLIVKRLIVRKEPYTASELAIKCKVPLRLTRKLLNRLVASKILKACPTEDNSKEMAFIPYVDVNVLSVGYLFERYESTGNEMLFYHTNESFIRERDLYQELKSEDRKHSSKVLLKDL